MLTVVLGIIGLLVGTISWRETGWIYGALAGLLCGQWLQMRTRLSHIEAELETLRQRAGRVALAPFETAPERPAAPLATSAPAQPPAAESVSGAVPLDGAIPQRPIRPRPGSAASASVPGASDDENFSLTLPTWITGGNLLVKVGVVILFFGVAFLLKYAARYGWIPIELRLAAVVLAGMALLGLGWRLRNARERYALALQGGGVGILYLTIFAALRLYQLIPAGSAFLLLVAVCGLSALLAILQSAPALAVLGFSGGFLAPVLASTGSGSYVALFTYYSVLNLGILAIAVFRSWRHLNLTGFLFTFIIAAGWGGKYYRPEYLGATEPFLLLFVVIFVLAAIFHARRQAGETVGFVDGTLVFGTPIVAFALQARLFADTEYALAWSAVGFGLFYLLCSWLTLAWLKQGGRILAESFFAFGVIFATLAIPLACDGRWTAAAWALEGAAVIWLGVRQQRLLARLFGLLLILAAGGFFLAELEHPFGPVPVFNALFMGAALISGAAFFAAWQLYRGRPSCHEAEESGAVLLFVWGALWWGWGGFAEIDRHMPPTLQHGSWLAFSALSALLASRVGRVLEWRYCSWLALAILPAAAASGCLAVLDYGHPGGGGALPVWPLALLSLYWILSDQDELPEPVPQAAHAAAFWLLTILLTLEGAWHLDHFVAGAGVWELLVFGSVPALLLMVVALWPQRGLWPVALHYDAYLTLAAGPVALAVWMWAGWATLRSAGNPWPLDYLPLLNPLDIALAFVAVSLRGWGLALARAGLSPRELSPRLFLYLWGGSVFFWGNGVLVRAVHHLARVPFTLQALSHSFLLQTTLTIAWCLCALTAMVVATRKSLRPLWVVGAILLAVVVAKLFFVDLAGTGTIERIVSFVGVGLLTLVIGWFAPVPPRVERDEP